MDPRPEDPLVDFDALRSRVGGVLVPVAGVSLLGAVVDGAIRGLTFALLGRWFGVFVLLCVLGIAVITALHALGGADRAGKRGERLASPDVGLAPRKIEGRSLRSELERAHGVGTTADTPAEPGTDADGS